MHSPSARANGLQAPSRWLASLCEALDATEQALSLMLRGSRPPQVSHVSIGPMEAVRANMTGDGQGMNARRARVRSWAIVAGGAALVVGVVSSLAVRESTHPITATLNAAAMLPNRPSRAGRKTSSLPPLPLRALRRLRHDDACGSGGSD